MMQEMDKSDQTSLRGELMRLHLENQKQAWEASNDQWDNEGSGERAQELILNPEPQALTSGPLFRSKVKEGIKRGILSSKPAPELSTQSIVETPKNQRPEESGTDSKSLIPGFGFFWGIIALIALLILIRLFWRRLQYHVQEYQDLKEESEKTYAFTKQNDAWRTKMREGEESLDKKAYGPAISAYEAALNLAQNDTEKAESIHHLGITHWQLYLSHPQAHLESFEKAEYYFHQVRELVPGHKNLILDNLSWMISLYQYAEQKPKAIKLTEQAIILSTELGHEVKTQKLEKILEQLETDNSSAGESGDSFTQSWNLMESKVGKKDKFQTLEPNQVEVFS